MAESRPPEDSESPEPADARAGQPGLDALRAAIRRNLSQALPRAPGRTELRRDGVAGLSVAIANVPDGLANAVLVGVNPVFGLYATMVGPMVGGLLASTRLMVISTTAAASLTAGQALTFATGDQRETALFVLVLLVGIIQVAAGLLRLGRVMRFVSYSVTTGFLTGVAVLLVLSQLPTVLGVQAQGSNRVVQTWDLATNIGAIEPWTPIIAGLSLALAVFLPRTPIGSYGRVLAVVVPSVLLVVLGLDGVRIVDDIGKIPNGIPAPDVPNLAAAFDMLTGALSVAIVILVQGTGISQSLPNPDGSRSSTSRDFIAQGAANIVSGLFRGLPVGGSASTTALSVIAGARSRWASIFAGIWMATMVILFPDLVGYVAMPALGALLILAGLGSIRPREIASVWQAGVAARLAGGATFVAMLFLPIQAAVGIGMVLSALLFLRDSYTDVRVVRLIARPDGRFEESASPTTLPSSDVTVLDVYGNLFYAGARTLEEKLPSPRGAKHPVVVIRLRGRTAAGATLVDVIAQYAGDLRRSGGCLYLTGIRGKAYDRLRGSDKLRRITGLRIYEATPILGESTRQAVDDARQWIASRENEEG